MLHYFRCERTPRNRDCVNGLVAHLFHPKQQDYPLLAQFSDYTVIVVYKRDIRC
jgi:hypothetical protein